MNFIAQSPSSVRTGMTGLGIRCPLASSGLEAYTERDGRVPPDKVTMMEVPPVGNCGNILYNPGLCSREDLLS